MDAECTPTVPFVDVSEGGSFTAPWVPAESEDRYGLSWSCGAYVDGESDVLQAVYLLTLAEARDVRITVHDSQAVSLGVFANCDPPGGANHGCVPSGGGPNADSIGVFRNMSAGTYVIAAQWESWPWALEPSSDLAIEVSFDAPTLPPANDSCGSAIDLEGGGDFAGTLDGAKIDYPAPLCSSAHYADVAYRFTVDEASDVEIVVDDSHRIVIVDDCAQPRLTHRACGTRWAVASNLPAGTYYVLVGNGRGLTSPGPDDFQLTARIEPAFTPEGDTCADAAPLSTSAPHEGDQFGGTDSLHAPPYVLGSPLLCRSAGYEGRTDAFYAFSLSESRHVELALSSDRQINMSLADSCDDFSSLGAELACSAGSGGAERLSLRDLDAGDYLVRLQTSQFSPKPPGPFSLELRTFVPDSTCSTPIGTIDGAGSTELTGNTSSSFDDHRSSCGGLALTGSDVVYVLSIAERSRVIVDASATKSAVAYVRSDCTDEASEVICADGTGAATLEPGTYYLVIDSTQTGGAAYEVVVDRIVL